MILILAAERNEEKEEEEEKNKKQTMHGTEFSELSVKVRTRLLISLSLLRPSAA